MSLIIRIILIGLILILIDWYFYQAVFTVFKGGLLSKRNAVYYIYWGFTLITFLFFISLFSFNFASFPKFIRIYVFPVFVLIIVSKLIGSVFIALDDVIRLFRWIISYFIKPTTINQQLSTTNQLPTFNPHAISRLKFLNYIALGMAALPFSSFIYGMVKGAFDYKIHREKIILPNLPSSFNGLKILQISDIHSGSFISTTHVEEAIKIVLKQNADIIFFTGDLVNNIATETKPFIEILSRVKAPMGIYSILGNHDYGDYVTWDSPEAKAKNLQDLKNIHAELGWKLMLNEHVALKKGDCEIALLGIENWGGHLHFPKYGDMKKAHSGTEKYPVKLLLSHDPSHWSMQVLKEYKDIDLTFSGHTHGFQFGVEIPGFKWSPSQYVYKQWAGLYSENNQHLYVNRGLGFLFYPGRVGILPEITVIELYNS